MKSSAPVMRKKHRVPAATFSVRSKRDIRISMCAYRRLREKRRIAQNASAIMKFSSALDAASNTSL